VCPPADGPGGHDFGTHGRFDSQARPRSWQARLTRSPYAVAALVNLGAAAVAGVSMVVKDRKAFLAAAKQAL
jgi:hypothetical protein